MVSTGSPTGARAGRARVAARHGVSAELDVLRELAGGAWDLVTVDPADMVTAIDVIERYGDQAIGIADAANVVLADRYGVVTLDRRHFDVLRQLDGRPFRVVP